MRRAGEILLALARVAIFGGLFLLCYRAAGIVARRTDALGANPTPDAPRVLIVAEAGALLAVLAATAGMGALERRSLLAFGLRGRRPLAHLVGGAAVGLAAISTLVGVLVATGHLVIERVLLHGTTILRDALVLGVAFLLVGLTEELLVRGYPQVVLGRAIGFWPSALALSLLFGFGHAENPGEAVIGVASAAAAGAVFCFALERSGSLWYPIGIHSAWDWGQSFLYGVPDSGTMVDGHLLATHPVGASWLSGGSTGPEGSAFVLLVFALFVPVTARFFPASRPVATNERPFS
jgi:membrane protease YdiL (CAAX protease family)